MSGFYCTKMFLFTKIEHNVMTLSLSLPFFWQAYLKEHRQTRPAKTRLLFDHLEDIRRNGVKRFSQFLTLEEIYAQLEHWSAGASHTVRSSMIQLELPMGHA